jgi:PAS domain S-box-containing protein
VVDWREGAAAVFGYSAEEMVGRDCDVLFTPEDRQNDEPDNERATAAEHGKAPDVRWHVRKDGSRVFIDGVSTAMRDPTGRLIGFLKIGQDVTERHRASELQATLLAELQHRVRNTLAVVRSIARRTAENSNTVEEMLSHFQGRLDAFSRVQAAVTRHAEGLVDLKSLIEDELVAHTAREGEHLTISGPEVELDPRSAERLSLALHELATNAVKHGALRGDAPGRIDVRWETEREPPALELSWQESGVTVERTEREGFGMELLRRSLPYDLQGETEVELRPDGLRFLLRMPLPA